MAANLCSCCSLLNKQRLISNLRSKTKPLISLLYWFPQTWFSRVLFFFVESTVFFSLVISKAWGATDATTKKSSSSILSWKRQDLLLSAANTANSTTWFSDITTRFLFLEMFWEDRVSTNHLSSKATCFVLILNLTKFRPISEKDKYAQSLREYRSRKERYKKMWLCKQHFKKA